MKLTLCLTTKKLVHKSFPQSYITIYPTNVVPWFR